jgi:hypothetical protein
MGHTSGGAPYGMFADELSLATIHVKTLERDQLPEA